MRRFFVIAATLGSMLLAGCGGGSSASAPPPPVSPPPPPPSVDDLDAETSGLVDSSAQGIVVTTRYRTMAEQESAFAANAIDAAGFGQLRRSRLVYRQAEGLLVTDDYTGSLLEIPVTADGTRVEIGEATRALSSGCDVTVSHALAVEGVAEQGGLSFRHEETVAFTDTGEPDTCADALNDVAMRLMNTTEAEFPFDAVTLLGLGAVPSSGLTSLEGWTLTHSQVASRWYRTIGDENFELVAADQRLALDVFDSADDRAARFVTQLTP